MSSNHGRPTEQATKSAILRTKTGIHGVIGDDYQRLLEAGNAGFCIEGDFLALMPSVSKANGTFSQRTAWFFRILEF